MNVSHGQNTWREADGMSISSLLLTEDTSDDFKSENCKIYSGQMFLALMCGDARSTKLLKGQFN